MELFLQAAFGWFLLATFGLLAIACFTGFVYSRGGDSLVFIPITLGLGAVALLGWGILFGEGSTIPHAVAAHPGAIILGIAPLIFGIAVFFYHIWRVEKNASRLH